MKVTVKTLANGTAGQHELSDAVYAVKPRKDILFMVDNWQRAKARAGTHATKNFSQVSGTTKKPFKQKGTGSARQGSLRSPQMRGGAVVFGPVVRDHSHSLPKKIRQLGLRMALSAKALDNKLIVVDTLEVKDAKTKTVAGLLKNLGATQVLVIDGKAVNSSFKAAATNIKGVNVLPQIGANVHDILRHETVILTTEAAAMLEQRLAPVES